MYKLQLADVSFYRVRAGQTREDIERTFSRPVMGEVFEGAVVALAEGQFVTYRAKVGDTFASVARAFSVDEEQLSALNGGVIYPTRTLFLPRGI